MGKSPYSNEFKAEAVRLLKAGDKSVSEAAKVVGVSGKTLREWSRQTDADAGVGLPGVLSSVDKEELSALRKECRELKRERDFLVQAAAYFAKVKR